MSEAVDKVSKIIEDNLRDDPRFYDGVDSPVLPSFGSQVLHSNVKIPMFGQQTGSMHIHHNSVIGESYGTYKVNTDIPSDEAFASFTRMLHNATKT